LIHRILSGNKIFGKIQLGEQLIERLALRLLQLENNLVSCRVYNKSRDKGVEYNVDTDFIYKFLNYLNANYASYNVTIKEFIYRNLTPIIEFQCSVNRSDFIELLETIDTTKFDLEDEKLMDSFLCYSYWIEDLELFGRFKDLLPESYDKWINSDHFKGIAKEIIDRELKEVKKEDAGDYKTKIESLSLVYPLDLESYLEHLEIMEKEYDEYIDHEIDMHNDREFDDFGNEDIPEDIIITEIFNSLRE
jgi:hypothetical protein